jgi:polyhydroxyalkanoate synthesis regulator phasin
MKRDKGDKHMKLPTKLLAIAAAGVVLAAGAVEAAGYVSAQVPGQSQSQDPQKPKDEFLNKLAGNLNVSPDQLKDALKTTGLQTVDDLVASGKLTQAQADKLKEKINSGQGLGIGKLLGGRKAGKIRAAFRKQIGASAATAIGISVDDLRGELKGGKSIADVAAEHNVSLDTVKSRITADVQARFDQAVQAGKLKQDRADAMLKRLTDNLDKILNAKKAA